MDVALQLIALAIQMEPQIAAWINAAQAANDVTQDQLNVILDSEHAAVAKFAADVQSAQNAAK